MQTSEDERVMKDQKVIQYFELYQEYQNTQQRLSSNMKNGFFDFTQARNQMGQNYISTDQIPLEEINPVVTINTKNGLMAAYFNNDEVIDSIPDQVKDTTTDHTNVNFKDEQVLKKKDPLHWFGIMFVSEHLEDAQTKFRVCLREAVHLANIITKMSNLKEQINGSRGLDS
ncbi:coiled-coil domain-containing protein [Acrasis kona]|uniref:Vacuolar ATPase assembly protein VMA22 n=1 Tax=Acrasis kona TaxID=1008807 RepID=A0AAW2ZDG7_9EUKA